MKNLILKGLLLCKLRHDQYAVHYFKTLIKQRVCYFSSKNITDPIDTSESHFNTLLIANRGEIACRIIRTARKMGMKSIAIYSKVDSEALHVQMADEAVCIGEAPSLQSYLCLERILKVAKQMKVDAVHPGYGFLSENAEFAKELEENHISFVGPSSGVISIMGDKLAAKKLAASVGVNAIPGSDDCVCSAEQCVEVAKYLKYPVMIKALAGGGGRGMRIARNDQEAREGFKLSKQEAASSFSDDRLIVEKFIESPRHIEIQILGDKLGNVIHLHERECSVQRRNQKVIEEAPSTLLTTEQRSELGHQAVTLCQAVGYFSAGTVEFLADGSSGNFYFLEVNPRIQVEHPTTEAITGIDLVHQMLRVAKGHPLKLQQSDIPLLGCSIECRVYAENPYKEFGLPSIGRLHTYKEPSTSSNIRCDSGVEEGSEISIHYDPLISKLVCHSDTRYGAITEAITALDSYVIRGVAHNIPLLRDILAEPKFLNGDISVNYLNEVYPDGFKGRNLCRDSKNHLLAAASCLYALEQIRMRSFIPTNNFQPSLLSSDPSSWRLVVSLNDREKQHANLKRCDGHFEVMMDGETFIVNDTIDLANPLLNFCVNGSKIKLQSVSRDATGVYKLVCEGTMFSVKISTELAAEYSNYMPVRPKVDGSKSLLSPMPGLVRSVSCKIGDLVYEGQELLVIEAMKMQNSLAANSCGKVVDVRVKEGDSVTKNHLLVVFD